MKLLTQIRFHSLPKELQTPYRKMKSQLNVTFLVFGSVQNVALTLALAGCGW